MLHMSPTGLQIMVVGGPNVRGDFHVEEGEELFLMLEGDMILRVEERGVLKDIPIKEGEMFLLPGGIPHSPQRFAGTLGLVIERARRPGELDGLRWYTKEGKVLYEETFFCTNLATQLAPVIARYLVSQEAATGEPTPDASPSPLRIDDKLVLPSPQRLVSWVSSLDEGVGCREFCVEVLGKGVLSSAKEQRGMSTIPLKSSELFLYLVNGEASVKIGKRAPEDGGGERTDSKLATPPLIIALKTHETLLIPNDAGDAGILLVEIHWGEGSQCLCVHY